MFGRKKSYSDMALKLASAALQIVDEKIESDLDVLRPEGIPLNRDWQFNGLFDIFSKSKKRSAERRSGFNIGLMCGVVRNYYDGDPVEFRDFLKQAICIGVVGGRELSNHVGSLDLKHLDMFRLGDKYSVGFVQRYLIQSIQGEDRGRIPDQDETNNFVENKSAMPLAKVVYDVKAKNIHDVERIRGLYDRSSALTNSRLFSDLFQKNESNRYQSFAAWALAEKNIKDETAQDEKKFHRNNLILNRSASADLFKPIEYSLDPEILSKPVEDRLEYYRKLDQMYAELHPDLWYAPIARNLIGQTIDFLKQLKIFLVRFDSDGEAFKIKISFERSDSADPRIVNSIDKLIEKIEDYRFSGKFEIEILPRCDTKDEGVLVLGSVRHKYEYHDSGDGNLFPPTSLSVFGSQGRKPAPIFYNFIFDLDPKLGKFLPGVESQIVYDVEPKFFEFALAFETMIYAIRNKTDLENTFLLMNVSGTGFALGGSEFAAEIFNSSETLAIYSVTIMVSGEFGDGHTFSEIITHRALHIQSGVRQVVKFPVRHPRASEGYRLTDWAMLEVKTF